MKILLIEDEELVSKNTSILLKKRGIVTDLADTIDLGYKKILDEDYDCIVIDRGLPDGDGLSLISKIREEKIITPILVLTARGENNDVILGLNSGADDYLGKPFDINVLAARIKALLRRRERDVVDPVIRIGNLQIDTNSLQVRKSDNLINLSPKEYSILECLAYNHHKVVDRMTLLSNVWGDEIDMFTNTVDVHINYLRKKIGSELIKTVRGKGYILTDK